MKISRTLSALAIIAILAPMPAAASDLTNFDQGRPARKTVETLRQRMAERRAIAVERRQSTQRQKSLRAERQQSLRAGRQLKQSSQMLRNKLQRKMRLLKLRLARRLR